MTRILRGLLILGLTSTALLALAMLGLWVWSRSPDGREFVRARLAQEVSAAIPGTLHLGRVEGLHLSGLEVADVRIASPDGQPVLSAERVVLGARLTRLWPPRLSLRTAIDGLDVELRAPRRGDTDGWEIARTFVDPGTRDRAAPAPTSPIGSLAVDLTRGRVRLWGLVQGRAGDSPEAPDEVPIEARGIDASGVVELGDLDRVAIVLDSLRAGVTAGSRIEAEGRLDLAGAGAWDLRARVPRLAGEDLRRLAPPIAADAALVGSLVLSGPLAAPRIAGQFASEGEREGEREGENEPSGGSLAATLDLPTSPGAPIAIHADLTEIDPRRWLEGAPAGSLTGAGRLEIAPRAAGPALVAEPASGAGDWPELTGELQLVDPVVADLRLARLDLRWAPRGRDLVVTAEAASPSSPELLRGQATVGLAAPHALAVQGTIDARKLAEVVASIPGGGGDPFAALEPLHLRGQIDVRSPGLVPSGSAVVAIDAAATLARGEIAGRPIDALDARLRWDGSRLGVSGLSVVSGATRLDASGGFTPGAAGSASMVEARLAGAVDLATLSPTLRGSARLEADLAGRVGEMSGTARISSPEIGFGGGRGRAVSLAVAASEIGGAGGRLRAELAAKLAANGGAAVGIASEVAVERRPGASGDVLTLDVNRLTLTPSRDGAPQDVAAPWQLVAPARVVVSDAQVESAPLRLASGGSSVSLGGRLPRESGVTTDLRGAIDALDLATLCPWLGDGLRCAGKVNGTVALGGDLARARPSADLTIHDLRWEDVTFGDVSLNAVTQTGLAVRLTVAGSVGGRLEMSGSLPLSTRGAWPIVPPDGAVDLGLVATDIDLARLLGTPPARAVRNVSGRISAMARVRGSLAQPDLGGELVGEDLGLEVVQSGTQLRAARVELGFQDDRVEIRRLRSDDGTLQVDGSVSFAGGGITPRLLVSLAEFPVLGRPTARAWTSGTVRVEGTLRAPVVFGNLLVPRARIEPGGMPGDGVAPRDTTIQVVRDRDGRPPLASESEDESAISGRSLFAASTFDVRVALGDSVVVQRLDAHVRLGGGLALWKVPDGELGVVGEITSNQGWYVFQGRRLELVRAVVRFDGGPRLDPTLDILAQYRSPSFLVLVRVEGTARRPELELSSQPSLSESDVLAVLLFGRPTDELSGGQGGALQQQALGLLASYVAPGLERSVANTLGLATITWQLPSGDSYGSLGVGRYFGDDLFVAIGQQFGGPQGGTQRQLRGLAGSSVTVQYYLTPQVTLQSSASTEGETALDLFWQTRYGRPPSDAAGPEATPGVEAR